MRTAAYARYSSEMQREASLEDQLRNCRAFCDRQGWPAPAVFTDAAASGARNDRPGYRALLEAVHQYDVILVDDLSRLSRDSIESQRAVKRLTFAGIRLIGVSDGVDTGRKSHKADVGLRGLMSELYLDDLADKTHRGLTGRALAGACAGGLAYGYRVTSTGERAIDEAQAAVVRRIFHEYINGTSPRAIAHGLNAEGIPSARGSTWAMSAVRGDARGIGILSNELYVGRRVWNRSRWVKHPDTGRRLRKERPRAEWIVTEHPELAIVDAPTWDAAQRRLRALGKATRTEPGRRGGPGRPPRHLLSGILRCGTCGSSVVAVSDYSYGCSRNKERGDAACSNALRVSKRAAEAALLADIQAALRSDEMLARAQRAAAAALKQLAPDQDAARRRLTEAERVRENILAALRAGIITPSTKAELVAAEAAVTAAAAEVEELRALQPGQLVPRARERWGRIIGRLADYARDTHGAREAIRELLGDNLRLTNADGAPVIEVAPSEIKMVAGVGFEPTTFGL